MTAYRHEYDFIKREGVGFSFLTQPVRVLAESGTVRGLECVRMSLGATDASGRPSPRPVAGSEFLLATDQIVKAIGQEKPALAALLQLKTEKGFISSRRKLRNKPAGCLFRRGLYSCAGRGFYGDGGGKTGIGRAGRFMKG